MISKQEKSNVQTVMVPPRDMAVLPLTLGGATPITLMPSLLAWEQPEIVLTQIRGWYLGWARRTMLRIFEEIGRRDAKTADRLHTYFDELPELGQSRFLLAPEIYSRVLDCLRDRDDLDGHVPFFLTSLRAERMLSGIGDAPEGCWSALGDFYIDGSESLDPSRQQSNLKASFAAPRVGDVPIDLTSPYCQYLNSMQDCPFVPYTPMEETLLRTHLEAALAKIAFVRESAARLFTFFVAVLVARKNPLKPRNAGSSSSTSHVGRIVFRNGHIMSIARTADCLVHEAIHTILAVLEVSEPFAD